MIPSTMEVSLPVCCLIVFISSMFIILTIVKFTMKEKTYEELLEERNKQFPVTESEADTKPKQGKEKRKKKKQKQGGRTQKVQPKLITPEHTESGSEGESDTQSHKMLELELEPEIIQAEGEVEEDSVNEDEAMKAMVIRKRNKDKINKSKEKQKSILVNKDEHSYTTKKEVVETFHPQTLPKDEIELQHQQTEKSRKKRSKVPEQPVIHTEKIVQEKASVSSAAPQTSKQKGRSQPVEKSMSCK